MKWLDDRRREPSTYAGLGAVLVGLGTLLGVPEVGQVGEAVATSAGALSTGDLGTMATIGLGALAALFR